MAMNKTKLTLAALLFGVVAAPVALLADLYRRPSPQVNGTLKLGGDGASRYVPRLRSSVTNGACPTFTPRASTT